MYVKSRIDERLREKGFTFDSYFNSYHNRDITHFKDKTIFIEEYRMTPNKWMSKIYRASLNMIITILIPSFHGLP